MNEPFIFERPDGTTRRVSGYRHRAPHPGTKRYAAARSQVERLPPKVDLRPYMTPVEDQGELSSCVANAVAGAYEYLVKRHRGDDAYDVSRLFVYYNARAAEGDEVEDQGSVIADALGSLRDKGACSEVTWPYDVDQVNEEPSEEAFAEAAEFLVEDMQVVPTDLDAWRHALAEGYPIVFGLALYDSFDKQRRLGVVPMPSPRESARASHSGHAMLCVGYSDPDRVFIVRNSWGDDWGDEGYCYIPYDYLMNPKLNDGDSWIIRRLENLDMDAGTWGDDASIVGDFDTELAKMSDEDYHAMLEAMGGLHLETRLALVFLTAAGADGEVSDEELSGIAGYLDGVLKELGSSYSAEKVLRHAAKRLDDEHVESSIELLGAHLPKTMLASILRSMREIVGVDDVSEEEEEILAKLVEAWQIEDIDESDTGEDDEDEDEDDEDEDEDEDEEDEGDGDEEDEDA